MGKKRKREQKWQTTIPPMVLYKNSVGTTISKKKFLTPGMQEWHFILVRIHKDAYKWWLQWSKQKKAATKDTITQNKGSHTKKMILEPKTPKISIMHQKCQNNDRKSMGKNLRKKIAFFKNRQNQHSRNITFSKNGKGTHKKRLPE